MYLFDNDYENALDKMQAQRFSSVSKYFQKLLYFFLEKLFIMYWLNSKVATPQKRKHDEDKENKGEESKVKEQLFKKPIKYWSLSVLAGEWQVSLPLDSPPQSHSLSFGSVTLWQLFFKCNLLVLAG